MAEANFEAVLQHVYRRKSDGVIFLFWKNLTDASGKEPGDVARLRVDPTPELPEARLSQFAAATRRALAATVERFLTPAEFAAAGGQFEAGPKVRKVTIGIETGES